MRNSTFLPQLRGFFSFFTLYRYRDIVKCTKSSRLCASLVNPPPVTLPLAKPGDLNVIF